MDLTQNCQHPFSGFCIEHFKKNYMKTQSQTIISFQANYKQSLWQVHYKPSCTLDLLKFLLILWKLYEKKEENVRLGEFYYLPNKWMAQFLEIDLYLGVLTSSKRASAYFLQELATLILFIYLFILVKR